MRLPLPFCSSARVPRLSTLLAHQFLAGFMRSRGTGLGCLFDHARSQAIDLLIDGLFNLGECRFRVACSPLRHGSKHVLTFFFPTLL